MVSTGRTVIPSSSEIAVPIFFVPRSMASTRIKESIEEQRATEQGFWFFGFWSGSCLPFPIVQPEKRPKKESNGKANQKPRTRNQKPETDVILAPGNSCRLI